MYRQSTNRPWYLNLTSQPKTSKLLPNSLSVTRCQSGEVGLLASSSGNQNQFLFVWVIERQHEHELCSHSFVTGIRSDLNEIILRVDQTLIVSLSRAMNRVHRWVSVNFLAGYGSFVERRSHAFFLLLSRCLNFYLQKNPWRMSLFCRADQFFYMASLHFLFIYCWNSKQFPQGITLIFLPENTKDPPVRFSM